MSSLFSSRCSSCAAKTGPSYSTCMRNFRRVRTHCVHTLRFGCEVRAARSVCPVGPVCVLCVSSGSPGVTPGVIQISPRMITIFETGLHVHEHVPEVPRTHTDVGGGSEGCATPSQWSCTYLEAVRIPLGSTKRPLWEVEVELSLQQSLCKSRWPEAGANFVPGLQHVKLCRVVLAGERENNTNNTITAMSRRKEGRSLHLGLFACLLANTRKKEAKIPSQHSTLHHPSSQVSTYKQQTPICSYGSLT